MSSHVCCIHRAWCTTLVLLATIGGLASASAMAPAAGASARASINGVDYGYEVRGSGESLLLLHGGLMSYDSFESVLPLLKEREVILVDLQGHGRTTLGNRPIRCEAIADDLDALLQKLGRAKVDVLGYSFGGGVALRLAIQHPERVRRLVLIATPYANDGWYADIYGDADMVRPEHVVKFYQLLGGGLKDVGWNREHMPKNRLAIIPDLTHYEAFASTRVMEVVLPFLHGSASPPR